MNSLMYDGKKSVAEASSMARSTSIEGKTRRSPVRMFQEALDNVMPAIEVRSRRVGGATYQVPVEVRTGAPPGAGDPLDHHARRASATKRR